MALFKCKMCGGALEINNNETVATCEYCGTQQTLPKLDDDKRANLYDRANHFRRNNEFDKAMGIYEQILNEDNTDAEAYWSLVLCRYGIEYVEDPSSHKRVPTVNRAQFTSIFDDDNYKSALEYADGYQKSIYEEEAKTINEIQKGILAISQKEEPFDVFICYKETDAQGRRTPDSVLANDLYHQLKQEGFKVFFARITLEDKLGSAYEPYIFAALNSAKVMVVLGTKPEFFNAVWVKNEWSRYLALIKNGANKMLIPAYKDMDPYDLPEEFSHLQAQDMSKLGFMQDLIRGIKKIVKADQPKTAVVKETVITGSNANTEPLLRRAFMFLEDGDWDSADEYCEKVLDINPECAEAYLGKLMAELKIYTEDSLCDYKEPFDDSDNYKKVLRFADDSLKRKIENDIEHINIRNEEEKLEKTYSEAVFAMKTAQTEVSFKNAANIFETIGEYKDSAERIKRCLELAEERRQDALFYRGKKLMNFEEKIFNSHAKAIKQYEEAIAILEQISGWRESEELIQECRERIEECKRLIEQEKVEKEQEEEKQRIREKKIKRMVIIATSGICLFIAFIILLNTVITPPIKYRYAVSLMNEGKYDKASTVLKKLGKYKDSQEKWEEANIKNRENWQKGEEVVWGKHAGRKIIWKVLEIKDGKALLLSENIVSLMTARRGMEYGQSSIRGWLNGDFLNEAFAPDERASISAVTVLWGEDEQDKIFVFSEEEVNKYLPSKKDRKVDERWWLRNASGNGDDEGLRQFVDTSGTIRTMDGWSKDMIGLRPAMWINIE